MFRDPYNLIRSILLMLILSVQMAIGYGKLYWKSSPISYYTPVRICFSCGVCPTAVAVVDVVVLDDIGTEYIPEKSTELPMEAHSRKKMKIA